MKMFISLLGTIHVCSPKPNDGAVFLPDLTERWKFYSVSLNMQHQTPSNGNTIWQRVEFFESFCFYIIL
jgi:hypothetical protein